MDEATEVLLSFHLLPLLRSFALISFFKKFDWAIGPNTLRVAKAWSQNGPIP
jgi:hypothetical protein